MKRFNRKNARRTSRQARQFGKRGLGRRNRPAALSGIGEKIQELQQLLEAGEITPDEFETHLEQLEAQQRHSKVAKVLIARARKAIRTADHDGGYYVTRLALDHKTYWVNARSEQEAIDMVYNGEGEEVGQDGVTGLPPESTYVAYPDRGMRSSGGRDMMAAWQLLDKGIVEVSLHPEKLARTARARKACRRSHEGAIEAADVVLLQNAVKQLAKMESADHAVRMLRDIIDAASEMKRELEG